MKPIKVNYKSNGKPSSTTISLSIAEFYAYSVKETDNTGEPMPIDEVRKIVQDFVNNSDRCKYEHINKYLIETALLNKAKINYQMTILKDMKKGKK